MFAARGRCQRRGRLIGVGAEASSPAARRGADRLFNTGGDPGFREARLLRPSLLVPARIPKLEFSSLARSGKREAGNKRPRP